MTQPKRITAFGVSSAILLLASGALLTWVGFEIAHFLAEVEQLNHGKVPWNFPKKEFFASGLTLGLGLLLQLNRRFGFAALVALAVSAFAGMMWLGMSM
jgi:hypothetical protein